MDLASVHNWCIANKLSLNSAKSSFLIIPLKSNRQQLFTRLNLKNIPLPLNKSVKYLGTGIYIDEQLNFKCHIDFIEQKIPRAVAFLLILIVFTRGGFEDTRLEAKAKDTKKSEAKDSLSEDKPSRGQEQECSRPRPRTKDTAASVLQKKVCQKVFHAISNSLAYPGFLIGGGLNHKSHAMTSSKNFQ